VSDKIKTVKQVCKCTNCGNEAEMVVTCSLEDVEPVDDEGRQGPAAAASEASGAHRRVKGTGTCTHCGNEADMWVDL
jgi:DNA-directed RNA polymerase subunit M/transcription elongation factor TFIIS